MFNRALVVVLLSTATACVANLEIPSTTHIQCASDADCIQGQRCLLDRHTCVDPTQSCVVDNGGGGLAAVADGSGCTQKDGTAGVCLSGQCGISSCGDGIIDPSRGETCDNGLFNSDTQANACRTSCAKPGCGDHVVDGGEACDDGNTISGDGCRGDCFKVEVCGDAVVDANETCDDVNDNPNDGCNQCALTTWEPTVEAGFGASGGVLANTHLNDGGPVTIDLNGTIYVADGSGGRLWRIDPSTKTATVVAGNGLTSGGGISLLTPDGVSAHGSPLAFVPTGGITALRDGTLLISDNESVRHFDPQTGVMDTVAGLLNANFCTSAGLCPSGAPAVGTPIAFNGGVVVATDGTVYFTERTGHTVRAVGNGVTTVVVGAPFQSGSTFSDGSDGSSVRLNNPSALAIDLNDVLYIADIGNHRILAYDPIADAAHLVAGNGTGAVSADGATAVSSPINLSGGGMTINRDGVLFFAEGARLRTVSAGQLGTAAGTGTNGSSGDGGPATSAQAVPFQVTLRNDGAVVFTELTQVGVVRTVKVRMITTDGIIHDLLSTLTQGTLTFGQSPLGTAFGSIVSFDAAANGDMVLSSSSPSVIMRIKNGSNVLERIAGGGTQSGDTADARDTTLSVPEGLRLLANGDVIFADAFEHTIRKISASTNAITTVAGHINTLGVTGDGGPATSALLHTPCDVEVAPNGDTYIYDCGNGRIRVISAATGNISTIVGNGGTCTDPAAACGDGGVGTSASISTTDGQFGGSTVHVTANGDVYFSETARRRIRMWSATTFNVQTIAGNGVSCGTFTSTCNDGGAAGSASFFILGGFDFLGSGLVIADARLRQTTDLTASGTISNYAFTAGTPPIGDGGPASAAKSFAERTVRVVGGNVYFNFQDRVRRITAGTIETVAGLVASVGDGPASESELANPVALTAIADDRWMIVDSNIGRLRTYDATAQSVATAVGYAFGFAAGGDPANRAFYATPLAAPMGITFDTARQILYVSESTAATIRTVTLSGDVRTWPLATVSGSAGPGYQDGATAGARYSGPRGLAYDAVRDAVWIADAGNHLLRRYDVNSGQVSTIAGAARFDAFAGDGSVASNAFLNTPSAIAISPADHSLYFADTGNNRVRRLAPDDSGDITQDSIIDTVLGDGEPSSAGTGTPARAIPVLQPLGLTFDSHNNLWVTSTYTIRILTPGADGVITGEDSVATIYGAAPRTTFPAEVSSCLSAVNVVAGDASALVLDSCHGLMVRLDRVEAPTPAPR